MISLKLFHVFFFRLDRGAHAMLRETWGNIFSFTRCSMIPALNYILTPTPKQEEATEGETQRETRLLMSRGLGPGTFSRVLMTVFAFRT